MSLHSMWECPCDFGAYPPIYNATNDKSMRIPLYIINQTIAVVDASECSSFSLVEVPTALDKPIG